MMRSSDQNREGSSSRYASLMKESRTALADVRDYTARFNKSERIKGKMVEQEMDMKFRTKPFSVYFLYLSREEQGVLVRVRTRSRAETITA